MTNRLEKQDEPNSASPISSDCVLRTPLYFHTEQDPLFGWLHRPTKVNPSATAILICPPIGHEYISSHRSLRHLADHFANAGMSAMRFDYHGTGDSSGIDENPDRLQAWLESIRVAINKLKDLSGCRKVGLVGVRFGASMAALIAEEIELACLVLWAPCIQGRHYLREMKFLQSSAGKSSESELNSPDIEGAGFVISAQTSAQIAKIKLKNIVPKNTNILFVARDDLNDDLSLVEQWQQLGLTADYIRMTGFAEFLGPPHSTKVPFETINEIVTWTKAHNNTQGEPTETRSCALSTAARIAKENYLSNDDNEEFSTVREKIVKFGNNESLFGILTEPEIENVNSARPTVILLNSGAVHHIGVSRFYVMLARHLAQTGFSSLRMDIEGLGDSYVDDIALENTLYHPDITRSIDESINYLKETEGKKSFVLAGLCFGAYASFHGGLGSCHDEIVECMIINPLTFYWKEGMSLDEESFAKNLSSIKSYKSSVLKADRWLKLLRGDVDIKSLFRVLTKVIGHKLRTKAERLSSNNSGDKKQQDLSSDINKLVTSGKHLSFIIADNDPGYELLMTDAKKTILSCLDNGKVSIDIIKNAYHTFPMRSSRQSAINTITQNLLQRYPTD